MRVNAHIEEVNRPGSEHTHTAAHNKFSDWTTAEFKKLMTLKNVEDQMPKATETVLPKANVGANPNCSTDLASCDYRNGSCLTPVKD